jgi:hypothetical protein
MGVLGFGCMPITPTHTVTDLWHSAKFFSKFMQSDFQEKLNV